MRLRSPIFVAAITALAATAAAHVAPSVDDNNRYLKLTPTADGVRLAYTVFYGEVPGATERRTIDADHDGRISDAEGHDFGVRVAGQVAAALEAEVDGKVQPVAWAVIDVGMGTPAVAAGSFSIDLVAYLCTAPASAHRVVVRDRFRIPHPGETEVKVEDAPGIRIERARVGQADDPTYDYRFAGPGGPLSDDGLELRYTVGAKAERSGACAANAPPAIAPPAGLSVLTIAIGIAGGVIAAGLVIVIVLMRRTRRRG